MTKADIAARIHQQTGLLMSEATTLLEWILEFLKTTLQAGESINISGFGKFTVRNKNARLGRNPRTGDPIQISARRVISFLASREFKARLNSTAEDQAAVEGETN